MTNRKQELGPPKYELKELVGKDDLAYINSIMVFDIMNRCNKVTVIATFEAQDVEFTEEEITIGYQMSEVAATAVKLFSSD